ncbi:MAG: TIR domain-containing protein, partial [Longimicrobiales bacterium]
MAGSETYARKVFLSYRSVDRERVREVGEALREAGIDAWLDEWEILPGDNFVTKINEGLEKCDVGVVFLSKASLEGKWHQDEITMLKVLAVDEQRPLIPVMLDADAQVPIILRPYSKLSADQIPQLIDAIEGRTGRPRLGEKRQVARRRMVIGLRDLGDAGIGVSAELDGKEAAAETPVQPGADFQFSYADFIRNRPPGSRVTAILDVAAERDRELHKLGDAVGRVVFAGEAGSKLTEALDGAAKTGDEVEVVFETESARLLGIPFEAARLADGRPPALLPGVYVWRRLGGKQPKPKDAPAGPLRVLVAVGAPDEGKTPSAVLDSERELQVILDALEKAQRLGNAFVRVLEVGSPEQIGEALRERRYDVLHISGHGGKGTVELEDEDGNVVKASAADVAREIRESGNAAPLVFLACCHGGLGDSESASVAQGLLAEGVASVVAMQTSVSDQYATELAGRFYEVLSTDERPLASRALAMARADLERERADKLLRGQAEGAMLPEYATPSLFLAGEEGAVIDRGLGLEPVAEAPMVRSTGTVPLLKIGDLIGRRREARDVVRVLNGGSQAGCQFLGTGGVGKSTVAGRVMQRMADRGWRVATVNGAGGWNLGDVAKALGVALWQDANPELAKAAQLGEAPDEVRLPYLQGILKQHPLLLVFDNFEDSLTTGGGAFRHETTAAVFQELVRGAERGKILVTSRYPAPGLDSWLKRVELGPLSRAESRKLMLRHEGLKHQPAESVRLIEKAIGGHPRTLEYLDALLRQGAARLGRVTERLVECARKAGVGLEGARELEAGIRDAVRVAAADALVNELIEVIAADPRDLEALWQASVFP